MSNGTKTLIAGDLTSVDEALSSVSVPTSFGGKGHDNVPPEADMEHEVAGSTVATTENRQLNPSESADDPRANQRREFEGLIARASALAAKDHEGARDLLKEAYRKGFPNGETTLLQAEIATSTGLSAAAVKALTSDAANHSAEYGYVPGVDELVTAMRAELGRRFGGVIATAGSIFTYADAASDEVPEPETHYWRKIEDSRLQADLLRLFPRVPAVQKPANRNEVVTRLHIAYRVDNGYFENAPPGVSLANGFLRLNLATGGVELLPHSKEHRTTYRLPFCYDPKAEAPVFGDGLLGMVGDDRDKAVCVLQFMFAIMFRYRPLQDFVRTVMVLHGPTGSGKSTLTELIRRFVPKHVQASIPPDLWSNGYHLANLRGVRLNTVTELEPTARVIKGASFKLVASHEPVTARQIRQRPVTFVPQAMHLFACNQLPTIGEGDRSLERRLIVLGVPKTPDEASVNPKFLDEVWAEAPGIVNLILEESAPMLASGKFTLPADNQKLVVQMQFPGQPEEHVARLWLEPAPGERVRSTDLQKAIRIAAEALGIDTGKWQSSANMKALSIRINKLYGATRHMTQGSVFYKGVRFTQEYAGLLTDPEAATPATDDGESAPTI